MPWIRFTDRVLTLFVLGVVALGLTGAMLTPARLRDLVQWRQPRPTTTAAGLGGGVIVAAPILLLSTDPIAEGGGAVAVTALPVLFFFALAGNLGEEAIFRGFLQGRLEQSIAPASSLSPPD